MIGTLCIDYSLCSSLRKTQGGLMFRETLRKIVTFEYFSASQLFGNTFRVSSIYALYIIDRI